MSDTPTPTSADAYETMEALLCEMQGLRDELVEGKRERDEARKLADSAMLESDRLRAKLKQARDCFSAAMELAARYKAEIDAMQ